MQAMYSRKTYIRYIKCTDFLWLVKKGDYTLKQQIYNNYKNFDLELNSYLISC